MKLYIKNMVSADSRIIVEKILVQLGLPHLPLQTEEVEFTVPIDDSSIRLLKENLVPFGLEIIEDKKTQLIEKIKNSVIEMVQDRDKPLKTNFSNYLSARLMYDYTYMANLFSKVQGITIEHFIILHKIERVKELLSLGQLTLTEISHKLHYSSVGHLSNQFKKVTGFTPSYFKRSGNKDWVSLEDV